MGGAKRAQRSEPNPNPDAARGGRSEEVPQLQTKDLEEQRKLNAIEMDKRCVATREYLTSYKYPMKPTNPYWNMSDDEFLPILHEALEKFHAKEKR